MYCRAGKFTIEEVFAFIKPVKSMKSKADRELFREYLVRPTSHRYTLFFHKGVECVVCGIKGVYFALEAPKPQPPLTEIKGYHFNLYALKDGREVLMTKDHIMPRAKGGKDQFENFQVMCEVCNLAKGVAYEPDCN